MLPGQRSRNITSMPERRADGLFAKMRVSLTVGLSLASLAGCMVADSTIQVTKQPATWCKSQLGQYVLPKSVIHIVIDEVAQTGKDKKTEKYNIIRSLTQEQLPHNETRYCFDYKPSPLSHDKVTAKTDERGFLSFISSDAADQTAYIVKTLVRAIFVGISQNPNFRSNETATPPVKVADLTFDPFNIHETAAKNARLVELGFCLVLEGITYGGGDTAQSYCEDPKKYLHRNSKYSGHYREILDATIVGYSEGILYRPRVPYTLTVYTKQDPDKPNGRWRPRQSDVMELENISPFIAVRLDRVMFAVKRVGLVFSLGELKNACVFKSSEALEAVTIPLEIVKSVVALPTGIFQVRFDNVTGARDLAQAQDDVIRAQISYLEFLNNVATGKPGGTVPDQPNRPQQPAAVTYGQTSKFSKLEFKQEQTTFWDSICNAPNENATGKANKSTM